MDAGSRLLGNVSLDDPLFVLCNTKKVPVMNWTQLVHTKLKVWSKHDSDDQEQYAKDILFLIQQCRAEGGSIDRRRLHADKKGDERIRDFCKECPAGLSREEHEEVKSALLL